MAPASFVPVTEKSYLEIYMLVEPGVGLQASLHSIWTGDHFFSLLKILYI